MYVPSDPAFLFLGISLRNIYITVQALCSSALSANFFLQWQNKKKMIESNLNVSGSGIFLKDMMVYPCP